MTSADLEAYATRLVQDAHDQDALLAAYNACTDQPDQYALFLETVGARATEPMMAAHWLYEAAGVWAESVGDAQRSAELLISALETDPTNANVGAKLGEMYRSVGDLDGLVHMQALRAAALKPLAESGALAGDEALIADYNNLLTDLSAHYLKPEALDLNRAAEYMQDAHFASPQDARLLPPLRDLLKRLGRIEETLPLYAQEIALTSDPVLRPHLVAEYMESLDLAGDLEGLTAALAVELQMAPDNTLFQQRYANTVHARLRSGAAVMPDEAEYAVACLLAGLAGREPGDALSDAEMALDLSPSDHGALEAYSAACAALGIAPSRAAGQSLPPGAALSVSPTAIESSMNVEGVALDFPTTASTYSAYQAPAYVPAAESSQVASAPSPPSSRLSEAPHSPSVASSASPLSSLTSGSLKASHSEAERLLHAGDRAGALATYHRILESSPADTEALSWVEDHLRSSRQYAELRDVLLAALRAGAQDPVELRKTRWRDVAGICESHLRDSDGAIGAWKQLLQLDPSDDGARSVLTRQLERLQRWDELASLLERQALSETDTEARLAMEKRLARVHEDKRGDVLSAGDAWARAARLSHGDEGSVERAVTLYEQAQRHDLALSVLREQLDGASDDERDTWVMQLAKAHEGAAEWADATALRLDLAERQGSVRNWEECERVADMAADHMLAARAARARADLGNDSVEKALWLARAASHLATAGAHTEATAVLKLAGEADLNNDEIAVLYDERLEAVNDHAGRIDFLDQRASVQRDDLTRAKTLGLAASLSDHKLNDKPRAKAFYERVLEATPSLEAYLWLADSAAAEGSPAEEARLLEQALPKLTDRAQSQVLTLRLAGTLSESLGRHAEAATLLEGRVSSEEDSTAVLSQLAAIYERDGKLPEALATAGKQLTWAQGDARASVANHMARLAKQTHNVDSQIMALEALQQLHRLDQAGLRELADAYREAGRSNDELRALGALEQQLGDEERPELALRRAALLTEQDKRDEALEVLLPYANAGHAQSRAAWVVTAEAAGKSTTIADAQFVWWNEAPPNAERTAALEDAFTRYLAANNDNDALKVAHSLLGTAELSAQMLTRAEALAGRARDNLALERAQRALVAPLDGSARATEFVRQAELRLAVGWDVNECVSHAEQGVSASGADAKSLLDRIATLLPDAKSRVGVYERQAMRAATLSDKVEALAAASSYARAQQEEAMAKSFLDTALSLAPTGDTCTMLELQAQQSDAGHDAHPNVHVLVGALSDAGRGLRDGGSFRSEALRHAAELAYGTLNNAERAWTLLGDSLSACPSEYNLATLRSFESKTADHQAAIGALSFALGGVFDATLSRTLLLERARIKREGLGDAKSAAEDLREAYDLSPADAGLWSALTVTLREAGDFRGLVSTYEDRLLRERDVAARQEYARLVARLWTEDLKDPREAADAWRRLLRLAPGDAEAQSGLELARNTVVGNPSIPPPASLQTRASRNNLEALRVTPAAPIYEPAESLLASADVLPDDPASSIGGQAPPRSAPISGPPMALVEATAGHEPDEHLASDLDVELDEVETLDDLDVIEG